MILNYICWAAIFIIIGIFAFIALYILYLHVVCDWGDSDMLWQRIACHVVRWGSLIGLIWLVYYLLSTSICNN